MSVLEIPRIYFRGQIAWDPVTTNNYPVSSAPAAYDEDDGDATVDAAAVRADSVAKFRQAAIDQVVSAGNWNPHGTYRSRFFDTSISGFDAGSGLVTTDPFVNAPVDFTGMLIDTEPYGSFSSQLFFDNMSFGTAGGCRIYGERVTRFHDRYVNFSANVNNDAIAGVASVLWQTCFPKDHGLQIDTFDSPALKALASHMDEPDVLGTMVRFCTYRTVYYDDPTLSNGSPGMKASGQALQAKLNAGGFQPNPARSLLVGTVGLWRRADPMHEPGDRPLVTKHVPIAVNPGGKTATCGTAFARLGPDRVTLDLSNCIPAANRDTNRVQLGDLELTATDAQPAVAVTHVATLSPASYSRSAYEATSGIVDVAIDPDLAKQLAGMDLAISVDGTTYLAETVLRAIPDDPNLYVDQGLPAQARVQVHERGKPAGAGIAVTMSELGVSQPTAETEITDEEGTVHFVLPTSAGKITGLVFQPGPHPRVPVTATDFDPQSFTYMYLRVRPGDADIAAMAPSWENVHDYVLSNWEAMAPCMDNWLRLGDREQVLSYAALIKRLSDPKNFESLRFMPITRDLSVGQRQLLYAFLDSGSDEAPGPGKTTPESTRESTTSFDFGQLSRSLRNPQT